MRSIVLSLLLWALAQTSVAAWSAPSALVVDPLIGLSLKPEALRFQAFSPLGTSAGAKGRQWVFARFRTGKRSLCIVSGLHEVHADSRQAKSVIEPDFGAVIEISGRRLRVLGVPDRLFDRNAIASPDIVSGLMDDAAERYVRAFGGPDGLERELAEQRVYADALPRVLVEALAAHRVSVPRREKMR